MLVLVSDTSVLIDLERGNLLELTFQGPWPLAVPDLLYQRELAPHNGAYLKGLGLGVLALSGDESAFAQQVSGSCPKLSLPDCFALALARRDDHVLLCGDGALRQESGQRHVRCHGLLWLLDELLAHRPDLRTALREGLQLAAGHPRFRLPKHEVARRLADWA